MKLPYKWTMLLASNLGFIVIGLTLYSFLNSQWNSSEPTATTIAISNTPVQKIVTALGKIVPKDKVISLSASSDLLTVRVAQILVREGDKVQRGQVIAILDSIDQLKAALEQAKQKVEVAKARLLQVQAGGAKKGEIAAQEAHIANLKAQFAGEVSTQQAKIARLKAELLGQIDAQQAEHTRLKAELEYAKAECDRYETLFQNGAVSASIRDSKCLEKETARRQLEEAEANKSRIAETLQEQIKEAAATLAQISSTFPKRISEAKANLNQIMEVRPVDVQVSQAELKQAKSAVVETETNLKSAYILAPFDGQILKIHTFPGERIGSEGIADLAQTQQMYVIAQVYETEINKIRLGQTATISSGALKNKFTGIVEQIGLEVGKKDVFNSDPTLAVDARVIEIKIRLNSTDNLQAASLINLEVEVAIDTHSIQAESQN
jgi:HlyD family secretion protein